VGGEFWAARRPSWVAAGLVLSILAVTVWLLRDKSGTDTATILALPVSVASLVVAVCGLRPRPPLGRVARELADRVARERGRARRQALGMSGDARPAEVAFRSPLPEAEPELVRWRSDAGAEQGTLGDVAGYFRSLDRGRLVVVGEPGAGKTVLATQLVIDLVEGLPAGELEPTARPPVPVWLSLPSLNLGDIDSLARASAEELAARLDLWIAAQMSAVYQIPEAAAQKLIRERWVLPVLDGLDEMDTASPDDAGHPGRPQAAAVVRALNAGTGRRPVVLVCRREEYTQMARSASTAGEDPVLQDASLIVLQPLDMPAICDYLTRRFPGERPGKPAARWATVLSALQGTTSPGQASSLTAVLSSPWRLFLATAAYQDDKSDPDALIRIPADEVGEHLLAELIPALTLRTPRPGGDHYPPGKVATWLGTLAGHLDQTSKDLQWSPTDLYLQQLWTVAGQRTVRRLSALASTAIVGTGFAAVGLLYVHRTGRWYPYDLATSLGLIVGICVVVALGIYFAVYSAPTLYRLDLRLTTPASRRELAYGLAVGLAAGLAGGLAYGLAGVANGPATALALGLAVGLAVWVRYMIGCWLARRKEMLPRRVGQFLDWAYSASLLRMSGTAIQFRHRDLQDWLVPHPPDLRPQTSPGTEPAVEGQPDPTA
jgi:hypothetical protein